MKRVAVACVLGCLLMVPVSAKGPTTRIVIKDLSLGAVTEITERAVLERFHVWAGRGTYSGPPDQTTEGTEGFIADWKSGVVDQRPENLRRYEVRFFASRRATQAEELVYVVLYEHDPRSGRGYVYFPGRGEEHFGGNVRTILRGVEGRWLYANVAWQQAVASLPAAH